jgi:hypothetical protein
MSKAKQSKAARIAIGLLGAAAFLHASDVRASSFVPLRAAELARVELIVRATATEVDPVGYYDPSGIPCTVVRMNVVEVIKGGALTSTLEFCALGGIEPDGRVSLPIGAPSFNEGETYLLFLKPSAWTISPVVNWTLGVLREVQDGDREILVSADGSSVTDIDEDGIQVGKQVDKPEQIRLLRAHDIPMDVVEFDDETGLQVSDAETQRRRAEARKECPAREVLQARLRARLPLQLNGWPKALLPQSTPIRAPSAIGSSRNETTGSRGLVPGRVSRFVAELRLCRLDVQRGDAPWYRSEYDLLYGSMQCSAR